MKTKNYFRKNLSILFFLLIFPFNLLSQVIPWVTQTYEGNDFIDVKCGSDVIVAADIPFTDKVYIFDNYSGNWQIVDLPNTLKTLAAGDVVMAFSDSLLYGYNARLQISDIIEIEGNVLELTGGLPDVSYACSQNLAMLVTDEYMYVFDAEVGSWQSYNFNLPFDYNYGRYWAKEDFVAAVLFKSGSHYPTNVVYSYHTKTFNEIENGCSGNIHMDYGFASAYWYTGLPITRFVGYSALCNQFHTMETSPFSVHGSSVNYENFEEYTVFTTYNITENGNDKTLYLYCYDTRRGEWTVDHYDYIRVGSTGFGSFKVGGQISAVCIQPEVSEPAIAAIYNGINGSISFVATYVDPTQWAGGVYGLCGGTTFIIADNDSAWGHDVNNGTHSYINYPLKPEFVEIFAGENFATFSHYHDTDNIMMVHFYNGAFNSWTTTYTGKKTGTVYSNSGGKYLFMLESNASDKETIFYSSITNTYHKANFPDGVTGTGRTSDYLACLNKSNGSYFFDANDGSITTLSYPMHIEGLSNSAAVTYDENTSTAYGYDALTKTWTQISITGELNLPPRIVEYMGIIPVDNRKGYYAYSAKHNFWGYLYTNDYKSEYVGENIACIRDNATKTLFAFYPDAVVGINEEVINSQPLRFELQQNYPNPFNPSTTIRFELPFSGLVTLKIYDVLGNEIVKLVDEELVAGKHEVEFNSHSVEVRNLSSGVYFYQLRAGDFVETKKMILLK